MNSFNKLNADIINYLIIKFLSPKEIRSWYYACKKYRYLTVKQIIKTQNALKGWNYCIEHGLLEECKWIHKINKKTLKIHVQYNLYKIIEHGHLNLFKWMHKKEPIKNKNIGNTILNRCFDYNCPTIFFWLIENRKFDDHNWMNRISYLCNLHIRNKLQFVPYIDKMDSMLEEHINKIKIMNDNNVIGKYYKFLIWGNQFKLADKLLPRNYHYSKEFLLTYLDINVMTEASINYLYDEKMDLNYSMLLKNNLKNILDYTHIIKNVDTLKWLHQKCVDNQITLDINWATIFDQLCINNPNPIIMKWIYKKFLKGNNQIDFSQFIKLCAFCDCTDFIKWFFDCLLEENVTIDFYLQEQFSMNPYIMNVTCVEAAIENNNYDCIIWLFDKSKEFKQPFVARNTWNLWKLMILIQYSSESLVDAQIKILQYLYNKSIEEGNPFPIRENNDALFLHIMNGNGNIIIQNRNSNKCPYYKPIDPYKIHKFIASLCKDYYFIVTKNGPKYGINTPHILCAFLDWRYDKISDF